MVTEEIKELQKMLEESRECLEKDLELSAEIDNDLHETLNAIKRAELASEDEKSHQLISDLFTAFCYLEADVYGDHEDCEECDFDEDDDFDEEDDE